MIGGLRRWCVKGLSVTTQHTRAFKVLVYVVYITIRNDTDSRIPAASYRNALYGDIFHSEADSQTETKFSSKVSISPADHLIWIITSKLSADVKFHHLVLDDILTYKLARTIQSRQILLLFTS